MGSYDRSTRDYIMKQAFSQSELHRRESLCVQEQPPFCLAKCPISLNGRALCSAVSSGDFVKGRGIIESLTPFVHILTRTCDGRCTAACKLAEIGDGISLRAVEQACVEHASAPLTRCLPTRKRDKRVAVLGDDLFCASLAWELSKKAYDVTLLIEHSCLCDALANEFPEIDKESIELDIATMNSYDCKITPVQNISSDYINSLRKDFDVICLSRDILNTHFPIVTVDCVTLLCESTAFFTESPLRGNTVDSLSDAKRAAASVDRFVQGVPVDRDRANEGSFETRLYTSLDGVSPSETLAREDNTPLSESEASSEAARCIGCECLECIKGCEFLRAYNRYPKKMLREIYNNLSIVMGDHSANKMINSCALCGQCTVVCPGGFDLSNACLLARETMVAAGKMPPSTHEFAMLDMQFSQSDGVFLTRNAQGKTISRYAFFPGCQMGAVLPGTTAAAYADLSSRLGGGVGLLLGCCGAIAKWA
ncbi:MAG: 4Fe-4S dicluster domain-containing protein, partial [Oscillospiraceae bacterium]